MATGHKPVRLNQAVITSPPTHHDFLHTEGRDRDKVKAQFQSKSPRRTTNNLGICDKSKQIKLSPPPQHRCAARSTLAASASPGESRAIRRIYGKQCYPRIDLDRGNNSLRREGATGAAIRRIANHRLCQAHPEATQLQQWPLPRDKPAVQAPNHGASGIQQRRRSNQETPRYRIGQRQTPVAPKA